MKLTIKDGRDKFCTFDTDRILLLTDDDDGVTSIHLESDGDTTWDQPVLTDTTTGSKYIEIPQEFLEGDYSRLVAYYYVQDSDGNYTQKKDIFRIIDRQEPEGYYVSYTHRATWDSIERLAREYKDKAKASEEASAVSEANAKISEDNAKASEDVVLAYRNTTKSYMNSAEGYKNTAKGYMESAKSYMDTTEGFKDSASTSATSAKTSETNAKSSEDDAYLAKDGAEAAKRGASDIKTATQSILTSAQQTQADIESLKASIIALSSQTITEQIIISDTAKVYKRSIYVKNGRPYELLEEVTA